MNKITAGTVYLVGAGPGDTGLITIRAQELIKNCDVLVYDALANPAFLGETKTDCKKIFVGKMLGKHSASQSNINDILIQHALLGKTVVRLKGGDPFVFGRGGEEAQALEENGIPYQIVPGVTSAIAALESAGIPVTQRKVARSFTVITGHTLENLCESGTESAEGRFSQYAKIDGTLVFLMGVSHLKEITLGLLKGGMNPNTPVSIVEQGTTVRERRTNGTLSTITKIAERERVSNPAVICVGKVAQFNFTSQKLSLNGTRVGVTGTSSFTEKLSKPLKDLGARVYCAPFLKVVSDSQADSLLPPISEISWIIFTSTNGVHDFFRLLKKRGTDFRSLSNLKFCVVGSGTANTLKEYGFAADYVPERYTVLDMAKGFSARLKNEKSPHGKICALRAKEGSEDLAEILKKEGIQFADIPIYSLQKDSAQIDSLLEQIDALDYITFASSSGASAFFERFNELKEIKEIEKNRLHAECKFVCIGEKTAETVGKWCTKLSLSNKILTASNYNADGIIKSISGDKK